MDCLYSQGSRLGRPLPVEPFRAQEVAVWSFAFDTRRLTPWLYWKNWTRKDDGEESHLRSWQQPATFEPAISLT